MKVLSTHEYLALIFQSREEVEGTLKGLQRILDRPEGANTYPAIQLHYTAKLDDASSAIIKRLKHIFKDEFPAETFRKTPVWEES